MERILVIAIQNLNNLRLLSVLNNIVSRLEAIGVQVKDKDKTLKLILSFFLFLWAYEAHSNVWEKDHELCKCYWKAHIWGEKTGEYQLYFIVRMNYFDMQEREEEKLT